MNEEVDLLWAGHEWRYKRNAMPVQKYDTYRKQVLPLLLADILRLVLFWLLGSEISKRSRRFQYELTFASVGAFLLNGAD